MGSSADRNPVSTDIRFISGDRFLGEEGPLSSSLPSKPNSIAIGLLSLKIVRVLIRRQRGSGHRTLAMALV